MWPVKVGRGDDGVLGVAGIVAGTREVGDGRSQHGLTVLLIKRFGSGPWSGVGPGTWWAG